MAALNPSQVPHPGTIWPIPPGINLWMPPKGLDKLRGKLPKQRHPFLKGTPSDTGRREATPRARPRLFCGRVTFSGKSLCLVQCPQKNEHLNIRHTMISQLRSVNRPMQRFEKGNKFLQDLYSKRPNIGIKPTEIARVEKMP